MTFPAIFNSTTHFASSIAGCIVALYLAYKEKGLITVAVVACIVAYIIELFI